VTKKEDQDENRKAGFAYAAGLALFASVVTFCGAGWLADKWFDIAPWGLIIGIVLGSAVGLYEFVRLSSKTY
jgi:F0F1-type ATP synthase assembly protein I